MQGKGLGVNSNLISQLNTVEKAGTLTGVLHRLANSPNTNADIITSLRTNMPGFSLTVPIDNVDLPAGLSETDLSGSIRSRANDIMKKGVKGFLTAFSTATAAGGSAFSVLGSIAALNDGGFSGMSPGVTNMSDQLTGGLTSKFGPNAPGSTDAQGKSAATLAAAVSSVGKIASASASLSAIASGNPMAIASSIAAVGSAINGLGTLYDVKKPSSIGDPRALVKSLNSQALTSTTDLGSNLIRNGIDMQDLDNADPVIIKQVLAETKGADLNKIVTETKLKVPAGVTLNSAADLLDASKILDKKALAAIPGGSLVGLGSQLSSLSSSFNSKEDLTKNLKSVEVPNFPALENLSEPVPAADLEVIKASLPKGKGQFGNPSVKDMLGTASGHVHNDALYSIIDNARIMMQFDPGQAFLETINQYVSDLAISEADELGETPAPDPQIVLDAIDTIVSESPGYIEKTNEEAQKMTEQLILELSNCEKAGVDPNAVSPGSNSLISAAGKLGSFGVDKDDLGTASMLAAMASDDKYGQAMQASMMEARNASVLQKMGAPAVGVPDPGLFAKFKKAETGAGLTQQQKDNIIAEAESRKVDPKQALSNASLFGYNSKFYEDKGYPPA